ncbi:CoA transferase [Kitasatospora fiedleri]|uniref:CoA transferase n=1 Tax=Kitasatospora fiedleri TaxID=2991545 RepID=UPI00249A486B|nr:CoA transferase [Kitasatospora fiedleri]
MVGRAWLPFQARYGTAACPLREELFAAARAVGHRRLARIAAACGVELTVAAARPTVLGGMPWRLRAGGAAGAASAPSAPPTRGPLDGVTVVEIARRVQGPLAGRVLALLGATVVRVEPPGGDPLRGVPPMTAGGGGRRTAGHPAAAVWRTAGRRCRRGSRRSTVARGCWRRTCAVPKGVRR